MADTVFFFRLVDVHTLQERGWAALSAMHRWHVVGRTDAVALQPVPTDREWQAIERELAGSLTTRCLPTSSAIHRALVARTSEARLGAQYVAAVPGAAVPSPSAAAFWFRRLSQQPYDSQPVPYA